MWGALQYARAEYILYLDVYKYFLHVNEKIK